MKTKETPSNTNEFKSGNIMKNRICTLFAVMMAAIMLSSVAFAEGTCGYNTPIVPDGRITQSTIPANTTFWYNLSGATPGRSYSVEFRSVLNRPPTAAFTLLVLTNCVNPYPGVRNTNTIEPAVGSGGERRSFTVSADNPTVMFSFTNPNSVAMTYSFSVSETTMYGAKPREFGGIQPGVEFLFTNTTNAPIVGVLAVMDTTGMPQKYSYTFPSGSSVGASALPKAGSVMTFTHDGPPEAIVADAWIRVTSSVFTGVKTENFAIKSTFDSYEVTGQRNIKFEARPQSH